MSLEGSERFKKTPPPLLAPRLEVSIQNVTSVSASRVNQAALVTVHPDHLRLQLFDPKQVSNVHKNWENMVWFCHHYYMQFLITWLNNWINVLIQRSNVSAYRQWWFLRVFHVFQSCDHTKNNSLYKKFSPTSLKVMRFIADDSLLSSWMLKRICALPQAAGTTIFVPLQRKKKKKHQKSIINLCLALCFCPLSSGFHSGSMWCFSLIT